MKGINLYNKKILELWQKFKPTGEWGELLPMFYDSVFFSKFRKTNNRILIVGINPSFSMGKHDKRMLNAAKGYNLTSKDIDQLHSFPRKGFTTDRKKCLEFRMILELQAVAEGRKKKLGYKAINYFEQIDKFLEEVKFNSKIEFSMASVDLLAMRHTNQKDVAEFCDLAFNFKTKKLNDEQKCQREAFIRTQVEYFLDLASALEPTLIIVASAYASHLIQKADFCGLLEIKPYHSKGHFYARNLKIKKDNSSFPVMFSSMFSGGHMTDGIRDLLAWNVGSFLQHKTSSASSKITTLPASNTRRRRRSK